MMKSIIPMLLLMPLLFFGQEEKETIKKVANVFQELYNAEQYKDIFELFAPDMKTALPLEQTTDFLKGLKSQAGKMVNRTFITYENGTYASYRTNFERALLAVNISLDKTGKINGLFVKPFKDPNLPKLVRNTTNFILPFNDEWTIFWGGDTKELNYHVINEAQKNAFDIVITDHTGKSYKTDGKTNEDYYAFGKELIAPCNAEVVLVVDGIKDNIPGEMNPIYVPGNTVILKTDLNEFLFFAHFKQNSIVVKQGQHVKQGDLLGLCGNSGNSSEAHLHFHLQNIEDMNKATGAKSYFTNILVNGELKKEYSPIKGEKVKNKTKTP
ncbi:M23 family metallopeptidase [Maribacter sp. MAR_2009_72]|uniref:M23 family metallopeptidase n=1 Tax=Maribacter sp. MAR_2009_72 TaxID=1250050 RepID=UPI00119A9EE3|nr:M23 family metallopeptidase [Maribacter sp. MAR_2009_72]TVZ15649.1 murein DD-endopeptidase MepM/ murein hydrolase activator NlpD [Maribacter sp. MAR_2009_72]